MSRAKSRLNSMADFDVITGPPAPSRPIPPASLPKPAAANLPKTGEHSAAAAAPRGAARPGHQ